MKIIPNSRRDHHLVKVCVFLITVALIGGMVGCNGDGNGNGGESYTLTITSTAGGNVTTPGEGMFTYEEGTVVDLVAEADEGYILVNWTGNVHAIADVYAASTTITMNGHYSITANFVIAIEIRDWYDLNAISDNLAGNYTLMNDLDSTTPGYEELASPIANEGQGWQPIGTPRTDYGFDGLSGTFDGQGYEIRDMFIDRPDESDVGLFGVVDELGVIKNVGVVNVTVTGYEDVGGLVGINNWGTVSNSYSTGSITGEVVGGLVGYNYFGTVSNSYSTGSITGSTGSTLVDHAVGGLVGINSAYSTVSDSYSTGNVTGYDSVGGLVGDNYESNVSNSHSTGSVTGSFFVGGLVGFDIKGTVSNSYSTGSVTGDGSVGGLMGSNWNGSTVSNSYSTGSVTGNEYVGGLVGESGYGTVSDSYATGSVTGNEYVGGLVGSSYEVTVSGSFWDTETSGQATSAGGTGKTTAEMQNITTFSGAGWDIIAVADPGTRNPSYVWNIVDAATYPFLSWQS